MNKQEIHDKLREHRREARQFQAVAEAVGHNTQRDYWMGRVDAYDLVLMYLEREPIGSGKCHQN
jgi:hypothetical protein